MVIIIIARVTAVLAAIFLVGLVLFHFRRRARRPPGQKPQ